MKRLLVIFLGTALVGGAAVAQPPPATPVKVTQALLRAATPKAAPAYVNPLSMEAVFRSLSDPNRPHWVYAPPEAPNALPRYNGPVPTAPVDPLTKPVDAPKTTGPPKTTEPPPKAEDEVAYFIFDDEDGEDALEDDETFQVAYRPGNGISGGVRGGGVPAVGRPGGVPGIGRARGAAPYSRPVGVPSNFGRPAGYRPMMVNNNAVGYGRAPVNIRQSFVGINTGWNNGFTNRGFGGGLGGWNGLGGGYRNIPWNGGWGNGGLNNNQFFVNRGLGGGLFGGGFYPVGFRNIPWNGGWGNPGFGFGNFGFGNSGFGNFGFGNSGFGFGNSGFAGVGRLGIGWSPWGGSVTLAGLRGGLAVGWNNGTWVTGAGRPIRRGFFR